jgi:hypothetical protein
MTKSNFAPFIFLFTFVLNSICCSDDSNNNYPFESYITNPNIIRPNVLSFILNISNGKNSIQYPFSLPLFDNFYNMNDLLTHCGNVDFIINPSEKTKENHPTDALLEINIVTNNYGYFYLKDSTGDWGKEMEEHNEHLSVENKLVILANITEKKCSSSSIQIVPNFKKRHPLSNGASRGIMNNKGK